MQFGTRVQRGGECWLQFSGYQAGRIISHRQPSTAANASARDFEFRELATGSNSNGALTELTVTEPATGSPPPLKSSSPEGSPGGPSKAHFRRPKAKRIWRANGDYAKNALSICRTFFAATRQRPARTAADCFGAGRGSGNRGETAGLLAQQFCDDEDNHGAAESTAQKQVDERVSGRGKHNQGEHGWNEIEVSGSGGRSDHRFVRAIALERVAGALMAATARGESAEDKGDKGAERKCG